MNRQLQIQQHRLKIFTDDNELIDNLRTHLFEAALAYQKAGRHYYLSLGGGTTPKKLYASIAVDKRFADLWPAFEIFFGDERYVPHDSEDSNYRMARQSWLDQVSIPPDQIHPVPTDCDAIDDCAARYAQALDSLPKQNALPCFDTILLGMGDDGHTASLFPGTAALQETDKLICSVFVEKLNSYRITSTYPLLNNARELIVVVTGSAKSAMLDQIFNQSVAPVPIQCIDNPRGLTWYLDTAAVSGVI